jgi:hypothetical protein
MCRLMPSWAGRLASFLGFIGLVLGAITMTSSTEGLFIAGLAIIFVGVGLILVGLSVDRVRAVLEGGTINVSQTCKRR